MLKRKTKQKINLPAHPKKLHKPFRWRHLGLFLAGLALGVLSTYRSGYFAETSFDVNTVSPAVVKVYHFTCGTLVVNGQSQGREFCEGDMGTGFLISSDGYVATSGHVVVRDAADILSGELQNNPALLQHFASRFGISDNQLYDIRSMSVLLAQIYDLPESKLRLENKRSITLVSLGDRPISVNSQAEIRRILDRKDDDFIKRASVVATDYSAKDLYVIEQQNGEGFSASDLALLKIDVENAPFIRLADTNTLNQNDRISLLGFPTDAENRLTSNSTIVPSVTNGTISSIRVANGSASRLFQTDADASQGNSGGPAINQSGEAIGVVSYRFKDENEANAAKSYVRDIEDLTAILAEKSINLNTQSITQSSWEEGLKLANQSKFSSAMSKYRETISAYPAHRLANIYGGQAQQAIHDGKDVKDPNYLAITAAAGGGGLLGVTAASVLATRHHRNHRRYRAVHQRKRHVISPSNSS
jgi:serine protease Do